MFTSRYWVLTLLLTGMSTSLNAVPVLGNLSRPHGSDGVAVSYNEWQASSFKIADTPTSWMIERVSLSLSQVVANASLTLRITGEAGFRPNLADTRVLFGAITFETQTATFEANEFPAPVLEPNQTYWLVLGVESLDPNSELSTGLFEWRYALDLLVDAGPAEGWSFGERAASAGTAGLGWGTEATSPFAFQVEATRNLAAMTLSRWRQRNPEQSGSDEIFLGADPDGNGLNGLLEYAFDNNSNHLPVSVWDLETGSVGLSYVRWSHAPGLTWIVEKSTDFDSWQRVMASDATSNVSLVGAEHERVTMMLKGTPDRVFFRVRVSG